MVFHFGLDFHVSSDQQIRRFRVALRAAEGFFMSVLIFIYQQDLSDSCDIECI